MCLAVFVNRMYNCHMHVNVFIYLFFFFTRSLYWIYSKVCDGIKIILKLSCKVFLKWIIFLMKVKAKKSKSYVSKLPRAFVFRCAFDSAKFKVWIFFCLLNFFFPVFYELACQNIQELTDTMKHFQQKTSSTLCSVLYLVHPKSSSMFQSCERLKSDTSAAQKKKKKKLFKKPHLRSSNLSRALRHSIYLSF